MARTANDPTDARERVLRGPPGLLLALTFLFLLAGAITAILPTSI